MVSLHIGNQLNQLGGRIGMVFTALPNLVKLGILQELVGIDLDLIRAETIPQAGEIQPVGGRRGAQQVGHPVQDDLETGRAQQVDRPARLCHAVTALVQLQDAIIQALHT